MPTCFVRDCSNSDTKKSPGVTFHIIPKNLKEQWLSAIGRDPNIFVIQQRVCSEHFEENDFERIGILKKMKPDVIPTKNLPKAEIEVTRFKPTSVLRTYGKKALKVGRTSHTDLVNKVRSAVSHEQDQKDNIREHPQASACYLMSSPLGLQPILEFTAAFMEEASTTGSVDVVSDDLSMINLPEHGKKSDEILHKDNILELTSAFVEEACSVDVSYNISTLNLPEYVKKPKKSKKERTMVKNKSQIRRRTECLYTVAPVSITKKLRCRTCLEVVNGRQCVEVSKKCFLEKTIKETILMLVPEMAKTLFDWDIICNTCCRFLKSSLKFIKKCLDVECTLAEEKMLLDEAQHRIHEHNYHRCVEDAPVTILPTTCSKDSTTSHQHNIHQIKSKVAANRDTFKNDIEMEHCDLLQESKIRDNLDSALNVSKALEVEMTTCGTCSEKFSAADYQLHLDIHPPFICAQCGKGFTTRRRLSNHRNFHHASRGLCDICGELIRPGGNLEMHKVTHQKEKLYMCHKCPKMYKTLTGCRRHEEMVHRGLYQQQCHECGKCFRGASGRRMHYRLKHLHLKPFVCNICGKKFGRKDYLQNHKYIHTSEPRPRPTGQSIVPRVPKLRFVMKQSDKLATCKICGKQFALLNNLRLHLRTHTKMRKYKCSHCGLLFTVAQNRDRHERTIHNGNTEHIFRCNICFKRTNTEEQLEIHMLVHKKKPPRYSCDTCGKKFYREYLLNNHRMEEHVSPEDIAEAEREIVTKNLMEYAISI